MSQREVQRYKVIGMAIAGRCTVREAAALLGLSTRQVKRLKKKVREKGVRGVVHGNSGKASPGRLPQDVRDSVIEFAREKYRGLNDTHMWEKLVELEGLKLSRATLRVILRAAKISSPVKRRPPRHRRRRERKPQEGLMLLWDGSPHDWLEGRGPYMCMISAIDDATSTISWANFEEVEDSASYLRLLRDVINRHGIPMSIYADQHGIFKVTRRIWTLEEELAGRQKPTQVARALEELGIELILARSPQAKGRVERLFNTLQDRLVSELRLIKARTREEANHFLHNTFIHKHNTSFLTKAAQPQKAYRKVPRGIDLDRIISFAYESIVGNDNTVRINNLVIDIPPGPKGRSYAKAKVITHQLLDGSWKIYHQDRLIAQAPPSNIEEPLKAIKHSRANSKQYQTWVNLHSKPDHQEGGDIITQQLGVTY